MTRSEAQRRAGEIKGYWIGMGAAVDVHIVPDADDPSNFHLETNLTNGLPPGLSGDELVRRTTEKHRARIERREPNFH